MKTVFSVVTPSFNHAPYIRQTIESVLIQRGKFLIDYIIMDGGSNDGTIDIIKEYENKLYENCFVEYIGNSKYHVPRDNYNALIGCLGVSYRWFSKKDNGQVDAINQGFRIADGDIYSFLNSDDFYTHDEVLTKIAAVSHNTWDFIYGKGMWCSTDGTDLLLYPTYRPSKYGMKYQCTLCQPAVFINSKTYKELGDFSTELHCAFDYEYWLRALFHNKKFMYINSVLAKSRMYYDNKSLSGVNTVRDEVARLHKKYFNVDKVHLNGFIDWLHKITVHRGTARRAQKLLSLMEPANKE